MSLARPLPKPPAVKFSSVSSRSPPPVASATSQSPSFRTAQVRARVPPGASESLTLPLPPRDRGKLMAAFKAGHTPTLTVKATAHDSARNEVPLSLTVRPIKP